MGESCLVRGQSYGMLWCLIAPSIGTSTKAYTMKKYMHVYIYPLVEAPMAPSA